LVAAAMLWPFLTAGSASATSPGHRIWMRTYDGPKHSFDSSSGIVASPDSSMVFVTGDSTGSGSVDFLTVAYSADGSTKLWRARYDGPAHLYDAPTDIGVSPDGTTVFVTGYSTGIPTTVSSDQIVVNAYDATSGAMRWSRRIGSRPRNDEALALAVGPDGAAIYVTGTRRDTDDAEGRTLALDGATGATLWSTRYEGTPHGDNAMNDVSVSPDGATVVAVGAVETSTASTDSIAIGYDAATGSVRWVNRIDGDAHDEDRGIGVATSPDSSVAYVTTASKGSHLFDYVTFAYDAMTGAELWRNTYDGPAHRVDQPSAIGVSPDGSLVFVTGRSTPASSAWFDYGTIAIDAASGATSWVKRYDGADDNDEAVDLAVRPDGSKVYVTGGSVGVVGGVSTHTDIATQGYDALTGAKLGVQRYNGCDSYEQPSALTAEPTGANIYVTGTVLCDPTPTNYVTLAYPA
jgi:hypothetical protein